MKSNTESKDTFSDPIILKMLEQPTLLKQTINLEMPFGKYKNTKLLNLPEPYLVWFHQQGFPKGKLGEQLALIYEIKLNGLEPMLKPLLDKN
jgi:uncharacterized protein (DUF3820 family)